MNFSCQRPYALYGLALLVPALIISIFQFKKAYRNLKFFTVKDKSSVLARRMKNFALIFGVRTFCISVAWAMLVLAFAGFSWGTYLAPVQTSGTAVSLVFDISYSMNADDASSGLSRLEASKKYAKMLLSHIPDTQISVVLAKGDGVTVLPLTDDRAAVESLIDSLSSNFMSSVGTSLGKGIKSAQKSFPSNFSFKNSIWVFTDGEETDSLLENSLISCVNQGISVSLIGFGTERETKVLAGDGKTYVLTALRSEKMKSACAAAMKKNSASKVSDVQISYIDATEPGSALTLLDGVKNTSSSDYSSDSEENGVSYEIKPVQRYSLFLGLGILFSVLSYVISELDPEGIAEKFKKTAALIVFCMLFVSCKAENSVFGAKNILEGSWFWYQKKYNDAVAKYLQTVFDAQEDENPLLEQYAVYNLATTYLVQNENDVALERYRQLENVEDKNVRYAVFYNCGIIANRKGNYEEAAKFFRNALKIDGTKIDAKINLELSLMNAEKEAKSKENVQNQVSESKTSSTMEESIFARIREYDEKQWKNSEKSENSNSSQDY
ncbi:MAG: VWA domain-containing protein [Treponema sp.]|jgi:Ca-activated chloride channel family protein|nr:VWA domain-containing protein [Treponema sp.]